MPDDPMKPMDQQTEHRTLSAADRDALAKIVTSKEFADAMVHGFVDSTKRQCSSPQQEPDTSLGLTFFPRGPQGGDAKRQYILYCTRDDNLAKRVDDLIRR